ncbi:MAG: hypothetical protein IT258_02715, partial [Saprospiraceae bacterium]|nr:hypothetical protein [Saprospiraceae bacterium]
MKNTNSLLLAKLLFSCLMASPALSLAQTQCNLGSITLNVVNLTPEILGNSELCPGSSTLLYLDEAFDNYLWSTGATGPNITVNAANTYTVTVTNAAGCTATDEFQVIELTAPIPNITSSSTLCNGQATLDAGAGFDTYAWSNSGNAQTTVVTTNGTYTVTVTNSNGCSATDNITVTLPAPPVVAITGNLNFCSGGNTLLTASPGFTGYTWTGGSTGSSLTVTTAGTYSVTATAANGCTATTSATVTTTASTPPTISGNLEFCQGGSTTITAQGAGYNSFVWSSGQNTPSITVSAPGNYTVTASASNGCTGSATAAVQAVSSATTSITGNTSICSGASTTLSATGSYVSYTWSNGMTGQSITVNQVGTYSVTVSAAQGCTGSATATVTTGTPPVVDIAPIAGIICEADAPFNLTASPSGGVWGGSAGAGGSVNPAALGPGTWTATYTFTDANGCTGSDQLTFQIDTGVSASIASAGPFCPTDGIQLLTAMPAGGTWGGAANTLGQFNPSVLGPGVYTVTYAAAATGNCASNAQIAITVNAAPSATISGSGTICEGSGQAVLISVAASGNGPLTVNYTINGATPTTLIVPAGTANLNATAAGVYEIISVADASGCVGNGSGQAVVNVVTTPTTNGVDISCDAAQTNYQVVFGITGGDPASYSVTSPIAGTLSGPPYNFTSALIPSGSSYEFVLTDANGCNPITLEGSFNCNCGTNAGSLDASPLVLCVGETASAMTLVAPQLEPNDVLRYYLHDGNGNSLGTVFGTSATPSFDFAPPLVAGQTYYISAVAGDGNGTGGIDLNDPCLSVSIGTPVSWQAAPTGSLAAGTAICMGEATSLVFSLSGTAPYDLSYSDGSQILVLQNILDNHSLPVSPTATTTYTLLSLEDSSPAACTATPGSSAVIMVNTPDSTTIQETSCVPSEVGVFTNVFTNQNGCDSTVVLTVSYQSFDETFLTATTCDPTMAGVFT